MGRNLNRTRNGLAPSRSEISSEGGYTEWGVFIYTLCAKVKVNMCNKHTATELVRNLDHLTLHGVSQGLAF